MNYAPITAALYNPVIVDSRTRSNRVLITRLDDEWLVVDRTFSIPCCVFLEIPAPTPCETTDEVKKALAHHDEKQDVNLNGTQLALMSWLAHKTDTCPLPAELDLEPVRLRMVKREREREKLEAGPEKKKQKPIVID